MPLPTWRAFSWVAITYLMLIVAITTPRVVGANWRSIMSPRDMRNLESFPVQWEAFLVLRSLHAMSSDAAPSDIIEWYSSDEYRATLPTYCAAIVAQITKSYIIGITISEVAWWWLGALSVYILARSFVSAPAAYCAGVLTCASPLGVGHVGSAHLHTASSLSLSVFLLIAWRVLDDNRIPIGPKILLYGSCLYLSSITYTYQWFIVPFFLITAAFPTFSRRRMIAAVAGAGAFLTLRWASYAVLRLGGLEVHTHQNDPLRFTLARISDPTVLETTHMAEMWSLVIAKGTTVILGTISSYHWLIVLSAGLGLLLIRDERFTIASGTAVLLAFAFGTIYDIAWVLMSSYPFVYALAAHGMVSGTRFITLRSPLLRDDPRAQVALLAASVALAITASNLDLAGNANFAIGWWRWWYTPH